MASKVAELQARVLELECSIERYKGIIRHQATLTESLTIRCELEIQRNSGATMYVTAPSATDEAAICGMIALALRAMNADAPDPTQEPRVIS